MTDQTEQIEEVEQAEQSTEAGVARSVFPRFFECSLDCREREQQR